MNIDGTYSAIPRPALEKPSVELLVKINECYNFAIHNCEETVQLGIIPTRLYYTRQACHNIYTESQGSGIPGEGTRSNKGCLIRSEQLMYMETAAY